MTIGQFQITREVSWGKPVWHLLHTPTGMRLPVNTFSYPRRRDAKTLANALKDTGITFSSYDDLKGRPADYQEFMAVLKRHAR